MLQVNIETSYSDSPLQQESSAAIDKSKKCVIAKLFICFRFKDFNEKNLRQTNILRKWGIYGLPCCLQMQDVRVINCRDFWIKKAVWILFNLYFHVFPQKLQYFHQSNKRDR